MRIRLPLLLRVAHDLVCVPIHRTLYTAACPMPSTVTPEAALTLATDTFQQWYLQNMSIATTPPIVAAVRLSETIVTCVAQYRTIHDTITQQLRLASVCVMIASSRDGGAWSCSAHDAAMIICDGIDNEHDRDMIRWYSISLAKLMTGVFTQTTVNANDTIITRVLAMLDPAASTDGANDSGDTKSSRLTTSSEKKLSRRGSKSVATASVSLDDQTLAALLAMNGNSNDNVTNGKNDGIGDTTVAVTCTRMEKGRMMLQAIVPAFDTCNHSTRARSRHSQLLHCYDRART